jgi:hypothetical protein
MADATTFDVYDEAGNVLSGEVEWGNTMDTVRYKHPMTGSLCENPLQGWADPPDAETGHATTARLLEAVNAYDHFPGEMAGCEHVDWLLADDGHLRVTYWE